MSEYIEKFKSCFKNLPCGVNAAEIEQHTIELTAIEVSGGEVQNSKYVFETAGYLRTIGKRTGYAHTESTETEPEQLLKRAAESAEYVESEALPQFNESRISKPFVSSESVHHQKLAEKMKELDRLVGKNDGIHAATCMMTEKTEKSRIINSKGLDVEAGQRFYRAELTAVSELGGRPHDIVIPQIAKNADSIDLNKMAETARSILLLTKDEKPIAAGKKNIVFLNLAMQRILTSFWKSFSAAELQNGASSLSGRLGEKIGCDILSIIDAPSVNGGYSLEMDCEGTPCYSKTVIENGIFKTALYNSESAAKAVQQGANSIKSTGNAGRKDSFGRTNPNQIVIIPNNIYIKPGVDSLHDLVSKLDDGILVIDAYDIFHTFNISSGEFSIPCCGIIIKNGKPCGVASGMTVNFTLEELFNQLVSVGNDIIFDEFIESFCTGSPSLLVKDIYACMN